MGVVPLEKAPPYTALSYTWKKQNTFMKMAASWALDACKSIFQNTPNPSECETETETARNVIWINGQRHMISNNLFDALSFFRENTMNSS